MAAELQAWHRPETCAEVLSWAEALDLGDVQLAIPFFEGFEQLWTALNMF